MKQNRKSTGVLKKVKSKTNSDLYYTYSHWETNEIDGVLFLPVVKQEPNHFKTQTILYLRKDSIEYVK